MMLEGDSSEMKHVWEKSLADPVDDDEDTIEKLKIKRRNKLLFLTPSNATTFFSKVLKQDALCFSLLVDKINMHQAFDLD